MFNITKNKESYGGGGGLISGGGLKIGCLFLFVVRPGGLISGSIRYVSILCVQCFALISYPDLTRTQADWDLSTRLLRMTHNPLPPLLSSSADQVRETFPNVRRSAWFSGTKSSLSLEQFLFKTSTMAVSKLMFTLV